MGGYGKTDQSRPFFEWYNLNERHRPSKDEPHASSEIKSTWETIGGVMKYFRMSWDEIMYERSWLNITMLSASIPDYSTDKDKKNIIKNGNELDKFMKL